MSKNLLKILSILVLLSQQVASQDTLFDNSESLFFKTIRTNQNVSYITFSQGIGNIEPLVFEALSSPNFLIRLNEDAKWGATITPAVLIRMFAEKSLPVRTPSYNPQLSIYHQLFYKKNQVQINYLYLTLAHHSNGQENSFFNSDGSINITTGSFSTNYIVIGTFVNQRAKKEKKIGKYYHTALELHANIDRSPELKGLYSFVRWHNDFRVLLFSKKSNCSETPEFQLTVKTTWLFGDVQNAKPLDFNERSILSITFNYHPKILKDVSFWANFYSGEDYYNMQFSRRITLFRIGLQAYPFK